MLQGAGNTGIQGPAKTRVNASQARVGVSKRKAVAPGKRQHVAKDPHPVAKMSDNRVSEVLEHIILLPRAAMTRLIKDILREVAGPYITRIQRPAVDAIAVSVSVHTLRQLVWMRWVRIPIRNV